MTTYKELETKDRILRSLREDQKNRTGDTKLLVSLHKIEFSTKVDGYFEVATDIFFSNLLYLLYIRNVVAGDDFETAKERAKFVLIDELEKKKYTLLARSTYRTEDPIDSFDTGRQIVMLDKALSVLETGKSDGIFCNYNVPESP